MKWENYYYCLLVLQLEALTPPGLPPGLGADTQNLAYVSATVRMPRLMALGSATTSRSGRLAARDLRHRRGLGSAQQPHAGEHEQARPT